MNKIKLWITILLLILMINITNWDLKEEKQIYNKKLTEDLYTRFQNKISIYDKSKQIKILEAIKNKIDEIWMTDISDEKKQILAFLKNIINISIISTKITILKDSESISPKDYQDILWVWINVDWLKTKNWLENYTSNTPKVFKEKWINHVRIRIKDDINEVLLSNINRVIDDCLSAWIIPIIAYQANEFKNNQSIQNQNNVINWWKKVSERFKQKSYLVSFDLIIEVTDSLNKNPEKLNELYEKTVSEIRKTNPKRIIFISPIVRSSPEYLEKLKIPSKHNNFLMAEWHFYAAWPSKTWTEKVWTTWKEEEKNIIKNKILIAKSWSIKNNIPTWVWAWMPSNYNDWNDYTIKEQILFSNFVVCELNKNNIPFAFNADNKFFDAEKSSWKQELTPVIDSILFPNCK